VFCSIVQSAVFLFRSLSDLLEIFVSGQLQHVVLCAITVHIRSP
jgi:hypothetical protein